MTLQQNTTFSFGHLLKQTDRALNSTTMRERPLAPRSMDDAEAMAVMDVKIPQDYSGRFCNRWCSCQCHRPAFHRSPQALQHAFGALSMSHKGLPWLSKPCDQKQCLRRGTPSIRMGYRFPMALLHRKLDMSYSCSALAGPELRVRLRRVVIGLRRCGSMRPPVMCELFSACSRWASRHHMMSVQSEATFSM